MNNLLEKRNTFLPRKYHQSNSVCVLKDFSIKLEEQVRQMKLMIRKGNKNSSLHDKIILPNIHDKRAKKLNHSIDNKLNEIEVKIINMEKGCQIFNNNSKLKSAFEEVDDSKQNSYRSSLSTFKQKGYPPFQPVIQPLIIYPTTIITSPMNFPSNYNTGNLNLYNNLNSLQCTDPFNGSQSSIQSNNISKPRRAFLKRKFRIISLSVFFIFLFKKYSKSITYMKHLKFEVTEDIFDEREKIQKQILEKLLKFNLYDNFFEICKKVELKTKDQAYQIEIPYEDQQIVINVNATERFLSAFLDHVYEVLKNNQFQELTLINAQFLNGSFPLSNMMLKQQLKLLNFNENGCLKVTPQASKMLIINYFFIKIIFCQLLCKKHLMTILKKAFHKKYNEKKFIVLYGKKLVVSFVLLYEALNSIFFNNMKKKIATYDSLPSDLKPSPMNQILYHFSINYDSIGKEKHLIKQINSSPELVSAFMQIFQQIWDKIKKITQLLYIKAGKHQQNQMLEIKQKIKNKPFLPNEKLKILSKKKRNKKVQDSEKQASDQEKTQSKSYKTGTSKSINANKKKQKIKK